MIFHDNKVQALDLKSPKGVQELFEVHLCGHAAPFELTKSDQRLLEEFVTKAGPVGVTFEQLNELLLVLDQDRISRTFFDFFFDPPGKENELLSFSELRKGVIRFKGFAMVCFGNYRFAFRQLSKLTDTCTFNAKLGVACQGCSEIEAKYDSRPEKVLDTSRIARDHTWFVGEITGTIVEKELKELDSYRQKSLEINKDEKVIVFAKHLTEMDAQFVAAQEIALQNTDVYLTWDHLDVYVATSMRNKWEYEEVFDFTSALFNSPKLTQLKLRHFDPTQSKCNTSRDKGLLEGLMLKRASCTIYMAQETDTLGKDSELATTLAQGKPVIAYIPTVNPDSFAQIVAERPLRYVKLRLLGLQASGILDQVEGLPKLAQTFLENLAHHRAKQPFELWTARDTTEFKQTKAYWCELCLALAEAERKAFDKRAEVLQRYHPLAMQVDLTTGVANGVLVVRSIEKCAALLRAILTNAAEFDIREDEGCSALVERISGSVFRVVTDNVKLTNSFWNLYEPRR